MFEFKTLDPKGNHPLLPLPRSPQSQEPNQRRMMIVALALLLVALGIVLYHDRDFWFPETRSEQDRAEPTPSATRGPEQQTSSVPQVAANAVSPRADKRRRSKSPAKHLAAASTAESSAPPVGATATRTVLPPLEVEVVAGDAHRTVRPGTNSVRVDLQSAAPAKAVSEVSTAKKAQTAANVTNNAAERVEMSADTSEVVTNSVQPGYPLLARQMKVQGSVILQALIGRDGLIQDLRVLNGPPILANAALEAVKQWHFKPHYLGSEAVETQARITVNFTISTN
jgi:TonB family protein